MDCHFYNRSQLAAVLIVVGAAWPVTASDQKWEVEIHAGGAFESTPAAGDARLPDRSGIVSYPDPWAARIVPSWYFGDGASQFNEAVMSIPFFGSAIKIVPLDNVLQRGLVERRAGGSFGFRVARVISRRFSAEFTYDAANNHLTLTSRSSADIEAARLSFLNAWSAFLAGPAARAQTVTSVSAIDDRLGRQQTMTGSLLVNLAASERLIPYAAVGAGVVANSDAAPSVRLTGNYRFLFPPFPPPIPGLPVLSVNETDALTVQAQAEDRFAVVIGGGLKCPLGRRIGLRFDIRDHIHGNALRTRLDAAPSTEANVSALIVFSTPRITFGSSPVVRSTLSGAPVENFETFRGTGVQHQINVSAGVFWRF